MKVYNISRKGKKITEFVPYISVQTIQLRRCIAYNSSRCLHYEEVLVIGLIGNKSAIINVLLLARQSEMRLPFREIYESHIFRQRDYCTRGGHGGGAFEFTATVASSLRIFFHLEGKI